MKRFTLLVLLLEGSLASAHEGRLAVPEHSAWKQECGSCHVAYPPQLLTAADWQRLMGSLDRHFGDNAALEPRISQEILAFLKRHAGSGKTHSAPSLRITETPWFRRAHHEVSAAAWTHPVVKTPANCAACHVRAAQGDWSEHGVRMPGGLRQEEEDEDEED